MVLHRTQCAKTPTCTNTTSITFDRLKGRSFGFASITNHWSPATYAWQSNSPKMQHSGAFRAPTNPHSSYRLVSTSSPAPTTPIRGATSLGNVNMFAREHTLELDTDENAPPDPSKEPGDDLPPPVGARMIGAFDAVSTAANTPRTLVARLSPARTLSGSVAGTAPGNTPPTRKNRIAFRGDPNMVTTFDKKVDGELYELWASK